MEHKKVSTSAEVYAVIFARHRDELVPFSSFSNPDGTFNDGAGTTGRMDTEWGFRNADCPLIGIKTTWDIEDRKMIEGSKVSEYWLCFAVND